MESLYASAGHFVHGINPVFIEIGRLKLWYYGLAYSIGFLGTLLWLKSRQKEIRWSTDEIYDCCLIVSLGILLIGHAFEVVVYEWSFYKYHLSEILQYWRGGMATHGVLLGAIAGIFLFCRVKRRSFIDVADELAIPAALFLGIGRIGNFINGENYGPVTDLWWGVKFPYAEGFRHPVDLYDGLKNFAVVGILFVVRKRFANRRGMLLAHLLFWYGFLRLLIDFFREYGAYFMGWGRGQYFNLLMAITGLALIVWFSFRGAQKRAAPKTGPLPVYVPSSLRWKKLAFLFLLLFAMTIPSGWSQGWLEQLQERQLKSAGNQ